MSPYWDTDITNPATLAEMVNIYKSSCARIEAAYMVLIAEQERLKATFGTHGQYSSFETWGERCYGNDPAADIIKKLKREVWRQLIERIGVRKLLSVKRADELDKNLREGDLPEIEVSEIIGFLDGLRLTAKDLVTEAAWEAFDILRPAQYQHHKELKTNLKNARFDVGPKVILGWMVESTWHDQNFRVSYNREKDLTAVDRVFHALDGIGMPGGNRCPLVDAINTCKDGQGETDYFRFKCYLNRNLHLEFKRMDLVRKLNQIGANGRLKDDQNIKSRLAAL